MASPEEPDDLKGESGEAKEEKAESSPLTNLLPKVSSKSDIGISGISLAIGFFLGSIYRPFAIPPAQDGLYFAAAALGVKNLVEASISALKKPEAASVKKAKSLSTHERLTNAAFLIRMELEAILEAPHLEFTAEQKKYFLGQFDRDRRFYILGIATDKEFLQDLRKQALWNDEYYSAQ